MVSISFNLLNATFPVKTKKQKQKTKQNACSRTHIHTKRYSDNINSIQAFECHLPSKDQKTKLNGAHTHTSLVLILIMQILQRQLTNLTLFFFLGGVLLWMRNVLP